MQLILIYIVFVIGLFSELLIIFGAWFVAKKRVMAALAKKNLETNVFALKCSQDEDPELFRLGNEYAELMRTKIWNGISDDLDHKFTAYNGDLDIRLKTNLDTLKAQIKGMIDEARELDKKEAESLLKQEYGRQGGQMKAANQFSKDVDGIVKEVQSKMSPEYQSLQMLEPFLGKANKKKLKKLLEMLETKEALLEADPNLFQNIQNYNSP